MLLYNDHFYPEQNLKLPVTNRAFQYNDGFFETIMVVDGKLRFWEDHLKRIRGAAENLQLAIPDYFWDGRLEKSLLELAGIEQAAVYGRIKLKVWRSGEGLYTPQTKEIDWLATAIPATPIPEAQVQVGICQTVRTYFSPLSHFKGPHAPLYVLAGIEKQNKELDDMLLLDAEGHVAELISSNIFWIKDGKLFTPSLETGCVNGILRRNMLRWSQQQGIATQEVLAETQQLFEADHVFAANVTGIRGIASLSDQTLNYDAEWLLHLKSALSL